MAGNAVGEAGFRALRPQAPPAGIDTKEQWRPTASRHSAHQRQRGPDGGGVDHWPIFDADLPPQRYGFRPGLDWTPRWLSDGSIGT